MICVYEAGPCGYTLRRQLQGYRVVTLKINFMNRRPLFLAPEAVPLTALASGDEAKSLLIYQRQTRG